MFSLKGYSLFRQRITLFYEAMFEVNVYLTFAILADHID